MFSKIIEGDKFKSPFTGRVFNRFAEDEMF